MEYLEAEAREVFDVNGKVFDYGKKKSTDLTDNKEVTLPKPMDNHTECSLEVIKNKVMKAFRDYKTKNCDRKGNQRTNLTSSEEQGLKSLQKRIQKGDIVALKTDKSGKMTICKMEDYIKMGLERTKNDKEISYEEVKSIQKRINNTTRYWVKILKIPPFGRK